MNNTENKFSALVESLTKDGLTTESAKLDFLINKVAWTTGSEFLGEFGQKMKEVKATCWESMQDQTKTAFSDAAKDVLKVWPKIGL